MLPGYHLANDKAIIRLVCGVHCFRRPNPHTGLTTGFESKGFMVQMCVGHCAYQLALSLFISVGNIPFYCTIDCFFFSSLLSNEIYPSDCANVGAAQDLIERSSIPVFNSISERIKEP